MEASIKRTNSSAVPLRLSQYLWRTFTFYPLWLTSHLILTLQYESGSLEFWYCDLNPGMFSCVCVELFFTFSHFPTIIKQALIDTFSGSSSSNSFHTSDTFVTFNRYEYYFWNASFDPELVNPENWWFSAHAVTNYLISEGITFFEKIQIVIWCWKWNFPRFYLGRCLRRVLVTAGPFSSLKGNFFFLAI